jgi:phosphoglycerate kinase
MNYLSQQNPSDFSEKRVVYRVDFNVPVENGLVSEAETFRIHSIFRTLEFLKKAGAKIILISHLGQKGESLQSVADYISKNLPEWDVTFVPHIVGIDVDQAIENLKEGECVLLENVRTDTREEENNTEFTKILAGYGDIYVEDAFGVMHRSHSSLVGIPRLLPSYAGFLLESEIKNLNQALKPESPSVLIMAGIKFETKLPLIEKLLPLYDSVILGGGLLNTYLKSFGLNVGKSVIDSSANLSTITGSSKLVIPEKVIIERDGLAQAVTTSQYKKTILLWMLLLMIT